LYFWFLFLYRGPTNLPRFGAQATAAFCATVPLGSLFRGYLLKPCSDSPAAMTGKEVPISVDDLDPGAIDKVVGAGEFQIRG
jgi:hypothetical protein